MLLTNLDNSASIHAFLESVTDRPAPYSVYTAAELWTDPHTAAQMLAIHLDPQTDLASRRHEFIDRSARWIIEHFGLGPGAGVCDLGCGPGLYTTRFARSGAQVTGIDFSSSSILHARNWAAQEGLAIEYIQANYLEFDTSERYDLITLIFCDYCALSPAQRATLRQRIKTLLKPGGRLLLDVATLAQFDEMPCVTQFGRRLMDGFWSAGDYFGFMARHRYEDERVTLDKYVIVEPTHLRSIYNWMHYYDINSLKQELESDGFVTESTYSDVAGAPYRPTSKELAMIARWPG